MKSLLHIINCIRLHAMHSMTLNYRTYLRRILTLDNTKVAEIDQISAKFLKDGVTVLALPLRNIMIKLSIKLLTFSEEC